MRFSYKKNWDKKELNNNNNNNNRIFFQSTQKKKQTHKSLQPVLTDSWRRIDSDSFRNAVDCRRLNSLCHKKKWPFTTTNADQHDNNEQNKTKTNKKRSKFDAKMSTLLINQAKKKRAYDARVARHWLASRVTTSFAGACKHERQTWIVRAKISIFINKSWIKSTKLPLSVVHVFKCNVLLQSVCIIYVDFRSLKK